MLIIPFRPPWLVSLAGTKLVDCVGRHVCLCAQIDQADMFIFKLPPTREPLCRPPAAPAGQGIGARPAGTVRGRRFSCLEPDRPSCPPLLSEKKSPDHPSSARPSPGMSLRALSPPLLWMIADMVPHLRTSCLPRRAPRARGALGDLDMCAKRGDRYSRPRGASPLASLIPARRQPTGGPARVP